MALYSYSSQDGTVEYHSTLFALVRQSLGIKKPLVAAVPSKEDAALRSVIKLLFPEVDKDFLNRIVPKPDVEHRVTIGRFYATYLIKEYFDRFRQKKMDSQEETGGAELIWGAP